MMDVIGQQLSSLRIVDEQLLKPEPEPENEAALDLADVHFRVQRGSGVRENVGPQNLEWNIKLVCLSESFILLQLGLVFILHGSIPTAAVAQSVKVPECMSLKEVLQS